LCFATPFNLKTTAKKRIPTASLLQECEAPIFKKADSKPIKLATFARQNHATLSRRFGTILPQQCKVS
jgi:hypothetical protein